MEVFLEEYYLAKILERLKIQQLYLKNDMMTLHQIYQKTVFSFFSHLIYHVILRKLKISLPSAQLTTFYCI